MLKTTNILPVAFEVEIVAMRRQGFASQTRVRISTCLCQVRIGHTAELLEEMKVTHVVQARQEAVCNSKNCRS